MTIPQPALDATWSVLSELGDQFWHLAAAPSGDVWAIGAEGLLRFDGQAWHITSLPPALEGLARPREQVTGLVATSDGIVWIGSKQDGLYRFEAGRWTHFTSSEGWPYDGVRCLAVDGLDHLWAILHAGEDHHLVRFDGQAWQQVPADHLADTTGLAVSPPGEIWLSPRNVGPYYFDGQRWLVASNGWDAGSRDMSLAADLSGRIWFGSDWSWMRWTGQGWQRMNVTIPAPFSYPVAVDATGGAWGIVTPNCYWCKIPNYNENGAVYVTPERSCRFTAADGLGDPPLDPAPNPLEYEPPRPDQVWDIAVAPDGRVWFITLGKITVFGPQGPVCDYAAPDSVRTPQEPGLSDCATQPERFVELWHDRADLLGCPVAGTDQSVPLVEQSFEHGWMLWRGEPGKILVFPMGESYREFDDTWDESQPEYSCPELAPAQTPPTPRRGFGKIWCTEPEARDALGRATSEETSLAARIQAFEQGLILGTDEGTTYILRGPDSSWERLPITAPVPSTPAPPSLVLERTGQIGGASETVAAQDHYAYLNIGPRLVILDVADPAHPSFVGQSSPLPGFEKLALTADYAYVAAAEGGLQVIDITDPAVPTIASEYSTRGPAWSIHLVGNRAYVAAGEGLHILDLSNPVSPADLGFFEMPATALDVTVVGNIAFVAEAFSAGDDQIETGGLRIVDVSDVGRPSEMGYYPMNPNQPNEFEWLYAPGGAEGVAVAGDYAYLTYSAAKGGGMHIVDVSDPASPRQIGSYEDYIAYVSEVTVVGDPAASSEPVYAYLATGVNFGLFVLDVSDPAQPIVLADEVSGWTQGMAVAGDRLFAADALGGLHIADISDPALPREIGSYDTMGIATDVAAYRNAAYVTEGLRDLWVVDVSDPALPVQAGVFHAPGTIEGVAITGTTAYIAAETADLLVVDVSDPSHPIQIGAYDTPGLAHDVGVTGDYAFVADGQVQVLDVSDPTAPALVAVYESPARIDSLVVAGTAIYLPGENLQILDGSDPAHPMEVGFYATPGWISDMAVQGDYAYVLSEGSLHIVDVSDLAQPVQVGKLELEGLPQWSVHLAVSGTEVTIAAENRLHVVDVSDPAAPREAFSYDLTGDPIDGLAVAGDCVYVAQRAAGLAILCR